MAEQAPIDVTNDDDDDRYKLPQESTGDAYLDEVMAVVRRNFNGSEYVGDAA